MQRTGLNGWKCEPVYDMLHDGTGETTGAPSLSDERDKLETVRVSVPCRASSGTMSTNDGPACYEVCVTKTHRYVERFMS